MAAPGVPGAGTDGAVEGVVDGVVVGDEAAGEGGPEAAPGEGEAETADDTAGEGEPEAPGDEAAKARAASSTAKPTAIAPTARGAFELPDSTCRIPRPVVCEGLRIRRGSDDNRSDVLGECLGTFDLVR